MSSALGKGAVTLHGGGHGPSSFGALSEPPCQALWLPQGTAKEGRARGDGEVVPWHFPSPADEFT